ncbi:nitronate monooxygenase [bacterium]|nr:nitronate monooxygenase [bacterium]
MSNLICDILGIDYPIILGGMSRIGTAPLAAAVSNAGGLGLLGAGGWAEDTLIEQIRKTRELSDGIFGVNFPVTADHAGSLVNAIITENIKVVVTSAGDPRLYTRMLQEHGIFVMHVSATVANAVKADQAGVDAVIAEGSESGGKTSLEEISTMVLVPRVVDSVTCPVIAAGGIGDGRGLLASLALGAAGVQMGTVFLSAAECEISWAYKQMLIAASEKETQLFRTSRGAGRAFKKSFVEEFKKNRPELKADFEADRNFDERGTGQITGLIQEILPVKEIIARMIRQASDILPSIQIKRA